MLTHENQKIHPPHPRCNSRPTDFVKETSFFFITPKIYRLTSLEMSLSNLHLEIAEI